MATAQVTKSNVKGIIKIIIYNHYVYHICMLYQPSILQKIWARLKVLRQVDTLMSSYHLSFPKHGGEEVLPRLL